MRPRRPIRPTGCRAGRHRWRPGPGPSRSSARGTLADADRVATDSAAAQLTATAIFIVKGTDKDEPSVVVSDRAPDVAAAPSPSNTAAAPAAPSTPAPTTTAAAAFPIKVPDKAGPHESQALAVNDTHGGIKYDVVYSLVTVKDGDDVDEKNSAYALASCKACTTVAVSFQLVLVVGQSDTITPINAAEALNVNCPSCITTAIADQIVVTLKSQSSEEAAAAPDRRAAQGRRGQGPRRRRHPRGGGRDRRPGAEGDRAGARGERPDADRDRDRLTDTDGQSDSGGHSVPRGHDDAGRAGHRRADGHTFGSALRPPRP